MRTGIQHNGIIVAVEDLPKTKNPSLVIYVDQDAEPYKVASFSSREDAEWFVEMMQEFLKVEA